MNSQFLKACRREKTDYTPIWLMRQAGRYMKEYRAIREKHSFLTMCKTPEIAAEVTLQPVKKLGVDAAIIFADILLPLEGMGINLEFAKNEGPIIHNPVRNRSNIESLHPIEPERDVPFLIDAIKITRKELNGSIPLIGFSGAPFTLASYIIEGGHSRNFIHTKSLMYNDPSSWHTLMEKIAGVIISYLKAQIHAGAQAVQLFDSWVGCLSPGDYKEFAAPYSKKIIDALKLDSVPIIHFGTDSSNILEAMKDAGGDVIGVDWRIDLDIAWKRLGYDTAIQGNLDPVVLFASPVEIEKRVKDILNRAGGRPGHIFNLGHGILPQTPVENVKFLVETVHRYSKKP
ncbi:MAG: uroporphyrinogen decarboxylase [Nitrospinae bacterium]|nr:uroporphyrinogen decarboxylase [Nitrospinota bacterium]MBI3814076.1 uroporphyrinogen decarboxylase [Nitrospinota bacterium]